MNVSGAWNAARSSHYLRAALVGLFMPVAVFAQQATSASISGRVTDPTGQPLGDSRLYIVGTSLTASSGGDGRYVIRNVQPGTVNVRVIRVGFQEQKKSLVVTAGTPATLDFSMQTSVVVLQDVVTTATGEQRKVELGNSIATLGDVGKRVETSPITNMSDLLVGKAAGVNILPGNMTGSAGQIHIRGVSSLSLTNNPIWVVDGVRFNAGSVNVGVGGTSTTFLNSLDPEEIEDIEIVKGPSAATLYGTDAANGVVVVTTKKGRAGAARWTFYGEGGLVQDKNSYPTAYAEWGHNATGNTVRCLNYTIGNGCTLDSLTSLNVLGTPGLSPLHTGHRDQYGMQVSGGTDAIRYFVSGDLENELGPVKMPAHDVQTFAAANIPVRNEWTYPEALQRQSIRGNMSMTLSPAFDLSFNSAFTKSNQRLPEVDNNFFSLEYQSMMSPGFQGAGLGVTGLGTRGENLYGNNGYNYGDIMQVYTEEDIQRVLGSITAQWHPVSWMQNEGTVGMDLADRQDPFACLYNQCPDQGTLRQGSIGDQTSNNRNFSAKLTSNSTWQARSWASMKTSVGADYVNIENDFTAGSGTNLPPGAQTVGATAVKNASNGLETAIKTLGVYVQEQGAFRDRLFLTAAVRTDQNSAFGTNCQRVFYPKVSASWIASDEAFFPHPSWLNQFRLRSAYGASGVQPGATQSFATIATTTVSIANADVPGLRANALGNPNLKPETSAELEAGFDSRLFSNRINVEFTYYNKKTSDALIAQPLAPSSAASGNNNAVTTVLRNLGSIKNNGLELTVNATVLDRKYFGWDATITGSHNTNKIISLGLDATGKPNPTIGTGNNRDSLNLPVNAYYYLPYTYSDKNGDGRITASEVTVGSVYEYRGNALPADLLSIQNGFDLLNRKLRVTAMFDYKGGYSAFASSLQFQCQQSPNPCYDVSNPNAPLARQARVVAENLENPSSTGGFLENGEFWRLREVSATLNMPAAIASHVRAHDMSLTFSARNLKLWTKFTGGDPEANYATGDIENNFASTLPPRYFILRLNLHY
jgi:TonB-linked SusC/RagA family outer membrane protein